MSRKFTLTKAKRTGGGSQQDVDTSDHVVSSKQTPAMLRMQRDLQELSLPDCAAVNFRDPNDLLNFTIRLVPVEGYYKGEQFDFCVQVGANYPIQPPKVKCLTPIFHPNIDAQGKICLNILRSEWRPVLNVNSLVYGLLHLLYEPCGEDALNVEAAQVLSTDPRRFAALVKRRIMVNKCLMHSANGNWN